MSDIMDNASSPPLLPVAAYLRMSTDMQQYSILNQSMAISAYAYAYADADAHGMRIVRSYRDEGKSRLKIENRQGLLSLMRDITQGKQDFSAILVLDVSRWGGSRTWTSPRFTSFCVGGQVSPSATLPNSLKMTSPRLR